MNKSAELYKLGQSLWYDNIDRNLLTNDWMKSQVKNGVFYGVTSNPSIFKKAISESSAYAEDIQTMSWAGLQAKELYERLALTDIRMATEQLEPVYLKSKGIDGYVSLEVDPWLANDYEETVNEAKRLWKLVKRKNLMIKVPATPAGIFAIRDLIAEGLNINVTLIFSIDRYQQVMDAYFKGLEMRLNKGLPIKDIHSVASFFVSRLDVKVESQLNEITTGALSSYVGRVGILNALAAYNAFQISIQGERFKKLKAAGGNFQRPLWASTGTKNPEYSDVLYVNNLVLPDTVNTAPPKTISAYLDHGRVEVVGYKGAVKTFDDAIEAFSYAGLNFDAIWQELEKEGVEKFQSAQDDLLKVIETKRRSYVAELGGLAEKVRIQMSEMDDSGFREKFFTPDVHLFTQRAEEQEEVLNRMGWLDSPLTSQNLIPIGKELLREVLSEGYTHAVVLGMGGSSLAPEVFSEVFAETTKDGLLLSILDTTDPIQIKAKLESIPIEKTLFIVSSKSGSTAEMRTNFAFFWNELERLGKKDVGGHFIAITDPGSALEKIGTERKFRRVINADPSVGGRFSALIAFGLIPAILAGIDGKKLLESAQKMREKCTKEVPTKENPAFCLGAILAVGFENGVDKITLLADQKYASVGSWLEQLIAESSGKDERGFIPIDGETIYEKGTYSKDRLFYYLRDTGDFDDLVATLKGKHYPVISSTLGDAYALTAEMYLWEMAVSVGCCLIGVNPFNQPNVQSSKSITHAMINAYKEVPAFDEGHIILETDVLKVTGNHKSSKKDQKLKELIADFLVLKEGDFIGINAFLPRMKAYQGMLEQLRVYFSETYHVPVTLGFGPRFLHSTGQLHKGGKNNGKFIILSQTPDVDLEIPGEDMNFSVLHLAQALGDKQALEDNDRAVMHIHLKKCCFTDFDLVDELK